MGVCDSIDSDFKILLEELIVSSESGYLPNLNYSNNSWIKGQNKLWMTHFLRSRVSLERSLVCAASQRVLTRLQKKQGAYDKFFNKASI